MAVPVVDPAAVPVVDPAVGPEPVLVLGGPVGGVAATEPVSVFGGGSFSMT